MLKFTLPARPIEVPPELLAMSPNDTVEFTRFNMAGPMSAREVVDLFQEIIRRQARGEFELREAAQILADAHDLEVRGLSLKIGRAFTRGDLRVFDAATKTPHEPREVRPTLRNSYVTAADIDAWLSGFGAGFRFPAPPAPASAPVLAHPEPVAPPADAAPQVAAWTFIPSKRETGYGADLNALLQRRHKSGKPIPTAAEVIEIWKANRPMIFQLVGVNLEYRAKSGGRWKGVQEKSLNEAIKKRTSA